MSEKLSDSPVPGGRIEAGEDVETALRRLPAVRDALVLGVPDPEWGQRVAAVLVPADGALPLEDLRRALAPELPRHAVPRQVVWLDSIPLLESGKPDRAAARELLTDR